MDVLNIMAVSLESAKKYKAYAVYDGSKLAITHCLPINGPPSQWRDELVDESGKRVERGFAVLVEDRTGTISQHATRFLFDDLEEGRTNLYHALDWYFSMFDLGSIIPDESVERYMVRAGAENSTLERKQDDKGRIVYDIQWSSFTGGHKAVLMCVVAAMMEPLSERYLRAMYGAGGRESQVEQFDPKRTFTAITQDYDRNRFEEFEQMVVDRG